MQSVKISCSYRSLRTLATGLVVPFLFACNGGTDDSSDELVELNDEYYAQLAQSYEAFVPDPSIGAATGPDDYILKGRWSSVIDWPEIATGAANLPDGRVMTWASTSKTGFGGQRNYTFGSIYDPITGDFATENNQYHNTFCAGVALLPDGRTIAAGGGATITKTSVFDLGTNDWSLIDELNIPRWYSTTTTLPDGRAITSLGTSEPYSEIWTSGSGWDVRTNLSLQNVLDDNAGPSRQRFWYPALNVSPDGSLFHAGPTTELFSLYVSEGEEGMVSHGKRENQDHFRLYNTTVMYDVGKMLIAGGGKPALKSAMTIDLNGSAPLISATNSMNHARSMHNSVVLPDGNVLVIGGNSTGVQFSDDGTQLTPEMWNPQTGVWTELAQHSIPRNYHSTALLLKDGRVASMGGGLCGGCQTNHKNGQIFEPPYLFNVDGTPAERPVITSGEANALAGDIISLQGSSDIVKFNMLRLVALTHHHTTDQRMVPLAIQGESNGTFQLAIPSNPNVVVPGYYWIYGLNSAGVPTVGHTIKINIGVSTNTTIDSTGAVDYEYYEGSWLTLPDFDSLTPKATGQVDGFNLSPAQRNDEYAIRFTSSFSAPEDGTYTFFTSSDDGSQLFVDGQLVVDNNGVHPVTEQQGSINLTAGSHDIQVVYLEYQGGQALSVSWVGPGFGKTDITSALTNGVTDTQDATTDDSTDGILENESYIAIEAEAYKTTTPSSSHNWSSTSLSNSSNGNALVATPNSGTLKANASDSPRLDYSGTFDQAGTWYVWIRGWGDTNQGEGSSDSIHAGLDGQLSTSADKIDNFPTGWNWTNSTRDGVRATLNIPVAGEHDFNLWMREDGLAIDKIVLTTDSTYVPDGTGPASNSGTTVRDGTNNSTTEKPPTLETPAPSSTLAETEQAFSWSGDAVDNWWLYIGTTVGSNNIYDSGNLLADTSTTVAGLPNDGSTLHVRLYYQQDGEPWEHTDYQLTAATTQSDITLVAPSDQTTLSGIEETFSWQGSANEWWLYVGSSPGASDYYNSGNLGSATTTLVQNLPADGSNIHARLFYKYTGSSWQQKDFSFTASTAPITISPQPGSTLPASQQVFTWQGSNIDHWWLYVGTSEGSRDLFDSGRIGTTTSVSVTDLPTDGSPIHVRLYHRQDATSWEYTDYIYSSTNNAISSPVDITTPLQGATLGVNQTFNWQGPAINEWWLYVGSTAGARDLHDSGSLGSSTSTTVTNLPGDGSQIHVRLFFRESGQTWQHKDFSYSATTN